MTAVLLLDATPIELGALSVLGVLPGALVAWWAGAWIDRRSRQTVMVAADWARAMLIATVPIAAIMGHLTLYHLAGIAAMVCMATVMFEIADHALLPAIVGRDHLIDANSRRETVDAMAEITGPPLGGLLVQWLTAPIALVVDAFSFVASALLIGRIRGSDDVVLPAATTNGRPPSLIAEARQGLAVVWESPLLRSLLMSTTLLTFSTSFLASLYTLFALKTLGLTPGVLGLVIGCGGIGALGGAALAPRLVLRFGADRVIIVSLLSGAAAQIFIPLAPAEPLLAALFLTLSQLIGDGLLTVYAVTEISLRQRAVADRMLGRAAAVWKMSISLASPAGMIVAALLAEHAGLRVALFGLVAGALMAAVPLIAMPRARRL